MYGKLTATAPHTCLPKNSGKQNETTGAAQAEKEAKAVFKKKLKRGYVINLTDVDTGGFEKPMKGDKWVDREEEVVFPVTYQDKINGVNFRIKAEKVISTGGELFYTVPHIIKSLAPLFKQYPSLVLMGEGYNPKAEFLHQITEILTVVKKPKDLNAEFLARSKAVTQCWLFDGYGFNGITETTPWLERWAAVNKLVKGYDYVYMLPYKTANSKEELLAALAENKARGGEGLMIRWGACPIKHGKSKYLLKLKHWEDAEFEILDVLEGNADWVGCAKTLVMKLAKPTKDRDGNVVNTFNSNIEGDEPYLRQFIKDKANKIGKLITIRYQLKSAYGIPQLPWAVGNVRDYE
jgi:hypothetical protein